MWMGAGLLVAVLGIGSTFAADIILNAPGGNTEFGQGVTRTVYCGGNESVTITPVSSYANTSVGPTSGGSIANTFTARFANNYSGPFQKYSAQTTTVNGRIGWWLTDTNTTTVASPQDSVTAKVNSAKWVFVTRTTDDGDYGYKKASTVITETVIIKAGVDPTPGATTPASFKVSGVVISNIPSNCFKRDFIVSAYQETGTATTLISNTGNTVQVKEVAVGFTGVEGAAISSIDRTSATSSSSLVTATQKLDSIKITFALGSGTVLTTDQLYKLVVETQETILLSN